MSNDVDLLLALRGVTKTFNPGTPSELTVIPGLDMDVARGEFVSVVGASGCGKSTLMNIIGLLDKPTTGGYWFNGVNMLELHDNELAHYRSENIGFVFQNFSLIGRISAQKNVELPMMYAGMGRKERADRARELLDMVGMGNRLGHQPNQLSGGQKQRVAIARALANNPELLLADEPTGALDSSTGRLVMDLFHDLNQTHGKTIVFITHNPELAAETERVITMIDGRVDNATLLGAQ
ncbi:ABC transporter ATP-binding protein [Corynebacterium argentoratense]|uniref:ABC transporter ATP-binding protein n=1 Tax=Corynebacterium argentoratense TaxID=42817 RepID=UPI001F2162EC|nr:ABC transporter ATP-binding protein [Corynebacterium argentoratense]MCF1693867.1 ABC transporter ATP-binding protein [Corynebacterium argentoratense]MCF1735438.1 ABC transporter ATP-binding protein [Corynebacterium argentoratense]